MSSDFDLINRSPPGLVDALCSRIQTVLQSFWQKGEFPDEPAHIPHVHSQYLPISRTESEERDKTKDYPVVLVVCVSGAVSDFHPVANGSEIIIQIHFGGYSNETDNQGWRIPLAMLWRVLQDLCADKLCNGYLLETPIEWESSNISEPPYYTAMMETKWKGVPPSIETPFEGASDLQAGSEEHFQTF
jgi:hypothetical protein